MSALPTNYLRELQSIRHSLFIVTGFSFGENVCYRIVADMAGVFAVGFPACHCVGLCADIIAAARNLEFPGVQLHSVIQKAGRLALNYYSCKARESWFASFSSSRFAFLARSYHVGIRSGFAFCA